MSDLGLVRILDTRNALALVHEFRITPPEAGPTLLWSAPGPEGTLATIDRLEGLRLWDWRGRAVANLGPVNPSGESDPAKLAMVLRAGSTPGTLWMQWLQNGRRVSRVSWLKPLASPEQLIESAVDLTGEVLLTDGPTLPASSRQTAR